MKWSRDCLAVVESTLVGINYYLHITRDIMIDVQRSISRLNERMAKVAILREMSFLAPPAQEVILID